MLCLHSPFKTQLRYHLFFFKDFICVFIERGKEERKRGKETLMCGFLSHTPALGTWPTTQACALTGNQTSDPLVSRLALNPLSHSSQGSTFSGKASLYIQPCLSEQAKSKVPVSSLYTFTFVLNVVGHNSLSVTFPLPGCPTFWCLWATLEE